jgi:hypothetical protein
MPDLHGWRADGVEEGVHGEERAIAQEMERVASAGRPSVADRKGASARFSCCDGWGGSRGTGLEI